MSPSTESWSHVLATAGRSKPQSTSGGTAASVSTTDSIVAMLGWIIPTPLAMPVMVTVTGSASGSGSTSDVVATLVTESVVRSASATASSAASSSVSVGASEAIPLAIRSSGRRVPMIPVERCRTRVRSTPSVVATDPPTSA